MNLFNLFFPIAESRCLLFTVIPDAGNHVGVGPTPRIAHPDAPLAMCPYDFKHRRFMASPVEVLAGLIGNFDRQV